MSNLLRTIQQVTRDYVDSISHRLPSIKNGTVTATSSDGTATVRVDGDTATTGSVPSIATVKTGDRVKMVLFNRQLTILGAIQRTDKLVADTIAGAGPNDLMRYLPGSPVGSPIAGFDANTVDRGKPSLIPINNGVNTPTKSIAVLETIPYAPDWVAQYFHAMPKGVGLYRRTFHSGTTWSEWTPVITDSGWVRITAGDSNYTSNAYVRRIGDIVQVRGSITRADSANLQPGWIPGIVPAGYQPMTSSVVMCAGSNAVGSNAFFMVSIFAGSGIITIRANPSTGDSTVLYLDGISWPVA